jgi:hypothetical protein
LAAAKARSGTCRVTGKGWRSSVRNDTHLFISQLHLAFLHFHNRVVDRVRQAGAKADEVFERAARMVRWHYQWIVLHEFLPLSVGDDLVAERLESGAKTCRFVAKPFIPVKFSDGDYRFGHARICPTLRS